MVMFVGTSCMRDVMFVGTTCMILTKRELPPPSPIYGYPGAYMYIYTNTDVCGYIMYA